MKARDFVFSKNYVEELGRVNFVPPVLYKYRSLRDPVREFSRSLLVDGEAYFAKPSNLNDPYDCKPHNTVESTPAERKAFLNWVTKGEEPDLPRAQRRRKAAILSSGFKVRIARDGYEGVAQEAFDKNLGDTGVFSLSENPSSNLMWSHYGDSHRGICIEFDFSIIKSICPMPVSYSEVRPSFNMFRDIVGLQEMTFLRKSADWAYEREWRSIGLWWSGVYRLPSGAIKAIILGAQISLSDRIEVLGWVEESQSKIEVREAKFQSRSYQLAFNSINR